MVGSNIVVGTQAPRPIKERLNTVLTTSRQHWRKMTMLCGDALCVNCIWGSGCHHCRIAGRQLHTNLSDLPQSLVVRGHGMMLAIASFEKTIIALSDEITS